MGLAPWGQCRTPLIRLISHRVVPKVKEQESPPRLKGSWETPLSSVPILVIAPVPVRRGQCFLSYRLPFLSLFLTPFLTQSHYCLFSVVLIPFLLIFCVTVHLPVANSKYHARISADVANSKARVVCLSNILNFQCVLPKNKENRGYLFGVSISETEHRGRNRANLHETNTWAGYYGCVTRLTYLFFSRRQTKRVHL
ncbi:hypothetical protein DER44DRAFT_522504 [Fusarium oxysporum]|nr:hypothetical protein DER44DRAFT_522504 [Fusarium oxysporum]